jgi:hypothetical protein
MGAAVVWPFWVEFKQFAYDIALAWGARSAREGAWKAAQRSRLCSCFVLLQSIRFKQVKVTKLNPFE